MRAVNLLPRDETKKGRKRPALPVLTAAIVVPVVAAALGAGFFLESSKVAHRQTEVDAAHAELALVPPPAQPDTVSQKLAGEASLRVAAVQEALDRRVSWERLLREISLVLPRDVWLSSLALQAPSTTSPLTTAPPGTDPASTEPAMSFTIDGKAFSHEGVARLLTRLALVPDLENVTLKNSSRLEVGKRTAVQFSITAGIRTSGAAS